MTQRLSLAEMANMSKPLFYGSSGEEAPAGGASTATPEPEREVSTPSGTGAQTKRDDQGDQERDPQRKIAALEDEKNRHYQKAVAAEQERDDLRRKMEEIERSQRSDEENRERDLKAANEENARLSQELDALRIKLAFVSSNEYQWHDAEDALRMADLSQVKIDKDGNVDKAALKAAIDSLAKSKTYLVKPKEEPKPTPPPTSGSAPKGKGGTDGLDREALRARYPGLRR